MAKHITHKSDRGNGSAESGLLIAFIVAMTLLVANMVHGAMESTIDNGSVFDRVTNEM